MCIGVISADDLPSTFEDEQSTFLERLGAGTDKFLQEFFCSWGTGKFFLKIYYASFNSKYLKNISYYQNLSSSIKIFY